MQNKIRVILTGTTGMVGEGVLHVCLQDPRVESILIINRKPLGVTHPKLKEIIHSDFYDISPIESQLSGYNACFFCLGITSVGISADDYYRTTYTLTLHVAGVLSRLNPDMIFSYVSGAGTDSSEKGCSRWARVKGKTENDLMKLPFRHVYAFRPGFIKPIPGLTRIHPFYKYINWLFPIGRRLYPSGFVTMTELALAMIRLADPSATAPSPATPSPASTTQPAPSPASPIGPTLSPGSTNISSPSPGLAISPHGNIISGNDIHRLGTH